MTERSLLDEIMEGARQRRLAEESRHEFQHGLHIDHMPVERNAPCDKHRRLQCVPEEE